MITPEMQKAYDDSAIPLLEGDGAIKYEHTRMRSWRYFLEINSACTLKCPSCTKGNMGEIEGRKYEHQTGIMNWDLMLKILDKIKLENPDAIVFTYGNSEPFVHPRLAECLQEIRRRGLHPEMSTNLNHIHHVEDVLNAHPDLIIISLSGFTQEVYVRGHAGGNIDKVKTNMRTVAEINNQRGPNKINIMVNYHVYDYNHHEIELMREYASNLGIGFFTSYARAISMENAVQLCRSKDPDATPFEVEEGKPDLNHMLPNASPAYAEVVSHMRYGPEKAREMYARFPESPVCLVGAGSIFTFIRHDGKTQLCACTADRRMVLTDYLDTTPEQMIEQRTGNPFCKQCLKYRLNLYFMIADRDQWKV